MAKNLPANNRRTGATAVLLAVVAALLWVSPAMGYETLDKPQKKKDLRFQLKGYVTSLWVFFSDTKRHEDYTLNTNRIRLEQDTFFHEKLHLKLMFDIEGFTGNYLSTPLWKQGWNNQSESYWNLSSGHSQKNGVFLRQTFHRAYLTYNTGFARLYGGKQRIAWGVMRFWRPTDVFNPESPLQIESGERTGIDALRVTAPLSDADCDLVYAPSRFPGGQITAGKFHFTTGDYDVSFMGGTLQKNQILGFTYDGYVGDGGFRGEMLRVKPYSGQPFYIWTIGADYTFTGPLTVTAEYLCNGGATGSATSPLLPYTGILQTKKQHFLGLGVDYTVNPLVTGGVFTSYDFDGNSVAISPRVTWNYKKNLDLIAGGVVSSGGSNSEYGDNPFTLFFQVKRYF